MEARVSLAMGQWQPVRAEIAMANKAGMKSGWRTLPCADDGGRFHPEWLLKGH
jgi:hypothetical protein